MYRIIKVAALIAGALAPAITFAASVNTSAEQAAIADSTSTLLTVDSLVMLGTFDGLTTTQIGDLAGLGDLPTLQASFRTYTSFPVTTGFDGLDGLWSTTFSRNHANDAGFTWQNRPMFLWIFNDSNISEASEMAIFTSTDADWFYKPEAQIPNSSTIDLVEVDTILYGLQLPPMDLGGGNLFPLFGTASFTAIPEPATYALLLGAASLGVVVIRRRRAARQHATATAGDA